MVTGVALGGGTVLEVMQVSRRDVGQALADIRSFQRVSKHAHSASWGALRCVVAVGKAELEILRTHPFDMDLE